MTDPTTTTAPLGAGGRAFPRDFLFGVATAAYQIEGAAHEDGRTDSIWDAFSRVPGAVVHGDNGDVACDHYHRFRDDVAMMADLGIQTYRFSTSWSRVRPDGGPVNPAGLDFYSRLVDDLLAHGIKPWLTLYHWDLPQALELRGGWTNRDTALLFADYATDVHDVLGDRIDAWTTLNEPWCSAFLGYTGGEHAPGRQDKAAGVAAAHHLLLGHGLAIERLRERDASLELGITLNLTVADAADPADPRDVDAARRIDAQHNRVFLDPIFRGAYPADYLEDVADLGLDRVIQPGDLATISTPIDVLGVNYYRGELVSGHPRTEGEERLSPPNERPLQSPFPAADEVVWVPRGLPVTAMGWEVQPDGLTRLLHRIHDDYTRDSVRIMVTENGAAYEDVPEADGRVHDADRVAFLRAHLGAVLDAIEGGVAVGGYFYWSLMDNFEWAWGYDKRFGLVRVDYDTQQRTLKDSAIDYRDIIAGRSL